jgi:hypothetical protein
MLRNDGPRVLDIEVSTAREWLRVGRELLQLAKTRSALRDGRLSYTKVRSVTRLATAEHEGELLDIAERTAPGQLGTALAAWSARNEDEATRNQRHQRDRSLTWRTEPDGMVTASIRMTPEQAALVIAAIDAEVMRGDGRETDPNTDKNATDGEIDASGTRPSHVRWSSLGQQRVDSLVRLIGGGGSEVTTEVILHVRADGCTLHDGTPIGGSIVERIASEASLRVMIHDAESRPINVSGTHRHHTKRQKLVVKERDDVCVDCGGTGLPRVRPRTRLRRHEAHTRRGDRPPVLPVPQSASFHRRRWQMRSQFPQALSAASAMTAS